MAESNIDIILKTKREGAQAPQQTVEDLKKMQTGLSDVEKAMLGSRTTIGGLDKDVKLFGKNVGSATDLLGGMGMAIPISPLMLFGNALQAGGKFVADSLDDYTAYVEQVDKISTVTKMASEDTSRLIQVGDDLRIEVGTIEMALKTMAQNGTVPSIEGIGQLSDKYLAIQDPLQQAQFLTDNFGRSGMGMARIMELGSGKIKDLTADVSEYMIITGKSKEEAEAYMQSVDNLKDSFMGLEYAVASRTIPSLTEFIDLLNSPSSDQAANFINAVFKDTFLESGASKEARRLKEETEKTTAALGLQEDQVNQLGQAWIGAAADAQYYGNTSRGNINNRPNVHNPGQPGYNPSGGVSNGSGRAGGGDVWPGGIYKVGERETEFITVGTPSMVIPGSAQGGPTINLYWQPVISFADKEEVQQRLIPFMREALRSA